MNDKQLTAISNLYVPNTWYTLTLNPKDELQYWSSKGRRCYNFITAIKKKLNGLLIIAEFRLYPEFACKTGRLHYHGIIRFRDLDGVLQFYNTYAHIFKDNFMYEIDSIGEGHFNKWIDYCKKNKDYMMRYFSNYNQVYKLTDQSIVPPDDPIRNQLIEMWEDIKEGEDNSSDD